MILLLNKDTWCSIGDFSESSSLATMSQEAWCSALHLEPWQGDGLVHFSRWTPSRKPASSDARPSSDDTPLSGGCPDTWKASDKKPGEAAVLWIKRGDVEAMQKALERARYLVKMKRSCMTVQVNVIMVAVVGRDIFWMAGEACKTASGA